MSERGGKKQLLAVIDGVLESEQSWREFLHDLGDTGIQQAPMHEA